MRRRVLKQATSRFLALLRLRAYFQGAWSLKHQGGPFAFYRDRAALQCMACQRTYVLYVVYLEKLCRRTAAIFLSSMQTTELADHLLGASESVNGGPHGWALTRFPPGRGGGL